MNDKIEQKICRMCGGRCCQYPMTQLWLKIGEEALFAGTCLPFHQSEPGRGGYVNFEESPDKKCPHLSPEGRCLIYRKRPWNCQHWPFAETELAGCMLIAWQRSFGSVRSFSR